jgi:hypothetical protein
MALVSGGVTPQASNSAPVNEKSAEFKAAKAAAAKKHAEKIKAQRQEDYEFFLELRDEAKAGGYWDKLKASSQEYILAKCVPPSERTGHTGPSFFTQIFGDRPAVGASVTLKDIITKTYKGMDTVNASIKKWAAKGVEVKTELNKQDMLATTYTIVKLPA